MKRSQFMMDHNEEEEGSFINKEILFKYLRFWPWFIIGILLCVGLGYAYMRYAPITYESVAKIKIIDESKELNVASDAASLFSGGANINLENEIEILRSYRLLRQVVSDLNLEVRYYEIGNIKTTEIWDPPFVVKKMIQEDSLNVSKSYKVALTPTKITINDEAGKNTIVLLNEPDTTSLGLPFSVELADDVNIKEYQHKRYKVKISSMKDAVIQLTKNLVIKPTDKKSEILSLSIKGESIDRSEAILNAIIQKFDQDGILDRQLVSRRTLEVIDKRFVYLSEELDSIEIGKQDYKQANRLSYIEADAGLSLQRKSDTEDEVIKLENQISLSKLLKETVINQAEYTLLPADIGLENLSLNALVSDYNLLALERDKLVPNVGVNHPTLRALSGQLERAKVNIIKSVNIYQAQLRTSLKQLNREKSVAGALFSRIPEKEKTLRAIERQQEIKEKLFLILLQKREEAAINLAATAPSIKVVDYGLTSSKPISPRRMKVYPLSLALGMLIPFVVLYIRFSLDSKIYSRTDIEKVNPEIPVLAEIPLLKKNKIFMGADDRSILAESFRILGTNINYQLHENKEGLGKVIFVTSAIKGEGKSLVAYNLSLSYASLKRRVLLIGADLRNPSLNSYLGASKQLKGLSDFLADPKMNWKDCIQKGNDKSEFHKVCFSGTVLNNAPELLSGSGFAKFLEAAKKEFDYIIVDTAPTVLVTDTLLISKHADVSLFIVRAGFTDKGLLDFSNKLYETNKLPNIAYVLNEVGNGKSKNYNYGYGYGYGS